MSVSNKHPHAVSLSLIASTLVFLVSKSISLLFVGIIITFFISFFDYEIYQMILKLTSLLRPPISRPPGWSLWRFAELCFSKKTFTQILEPALSDMQKEHFEALATGRSWKARMVLVRGYWSFWSTVIAQLPIPFGRLVYKILKTTKTGS